MFQSHFSFNTETSKSSVENGERFANTEVREMHLSVPSPTDTCLHLSVSFQFYWFFFSVHEGVSLEKKLLVVKLHLRRNLNMWWKAALEVWSAENYVLIRKILIVLGIYLFCALLRTEQLKKKSLLHHYKNPLDIKNDFDLSCCVCMAECNLQLPVFWVRELKVIGARRRGSSGGKEAATWYPTMELPSDKALSSFVWSQD